MARRWSWRSEVMHYCDDLVVDGDLVGVEYYWFHGGVGWGEYDLVVFVIVELDGCFFVWDVRDDGVV